MITEIGALTSGKTYLEELQEGSNPGVNAPQSNLGQAEFLRLLTTQLANQDPTNPVDAKDFVTDLTQMSQLESMSEMTQSVQAMSVGFQSMQTIQAATLVGRNVQVVGTEMTHTKGQETDIKLAMNEPLEDVTVVISDEDGIVKELFLDDLVSGEHTATWDGLDDVGAERDSGQYTLTVYGTNEEGELQSINTIIPSQIDNVKINDNGTLTLTLATGEEVPMDSVREISI